MIEAPDRLKTLHKPETKEEGETKGLTETFQITNYLSMPLGNKLRVKTYSNTLGEKHF